MTKAPLHALFVGSDTLLLQCAAEFLDRGHRIVAIATDNDRVRAFARERELPCIDAAELEARIGGLECDLLFAVTWLRLLPAAVLRAPRRLAINFHDGPLPRYAGLNAPCWALQHGEREHGVTWHAIEPKADTGAILLQQRFAIAADDTAFTLNARCFQAGLETFATLLTGLETGTLQPQPQDLAQRTWFGRDARPAGLGVLDWDQDAATVARTCRALDHGGRQNPVATAKLWTGADVLVPGHATVTTASGALPGTITAADDRRVVVACKGGEVAFAGLQTLDGRPVDAALRQRLGLRVGMALPLLDDEQRRHLQQLAGTTARAEGKALATLRALEPLAVPGGAAAGDLADPAELAIVLPQLLPPERTAALCMVFAARLAAARRGHLGLRCPETAPVGDLGAALCVPFAPLALDVDPDAAAGAALERCADALATARARGPLLRDLALRNPDQLHRGEIAQPPLRLLLASADPDAPAPASLQVAPGAVEFAIDGQGGLVLRYDRATLPTARAEEWRDRLLRLSGAVHGNPTVPLRQLPLLDDAEVERLLAHGRGPTAPAPVEPCVHRQFAARAAATPGAVALQDGDRAITYRALIEQVEQLAARLAQAGVGRGDRVGLCLRRGPLLPTAALAVLRCGACYVPLDPSYPQERLQFMADDAGLRALVVDAAARERAPRTRAARIDLDEPAPTDAPPPPADTATGDDLAYVIYTSGSTGTPKGVMVGHDNVANFFLGMDEVLGGEQEVARRGTWLAVTSLSFDISVLELLWTLCRGFTVVVHGGEGHAAQSAAAASDAAAAARRARPLTFSLFYFASDEGEHAADKYRLLLDGARFADQHGFEAVWTPERHFHAFGGLYPNPVVASAALASITERVHIRAGSVVSPLHSPIRIAEDWALVDNLSNGRVGISFAAGWQPNDFVLAPQNFQDRKQRMFEDIRAVHALWRGERVAFPGHDGRPVEVRTLPRPVQATLPTWVTIAGNPETYRMAGESGAFVLTHLLGQSLDDLAHKLEVYRKAWADAGHAGGPRVTLMLHTFVGDDDAQVRAAVREPMKDYLRSSVDLIRQAAWSFPAFKQRTDGSQSQMEALFQKGLADEELDALLDFAFERYYRTSGLFGDLETCTATLDKLRAIGVDEVACLIDFGIPSDLVLRHLPHLQRLKQRSDAQATGAAAAPAAAVCGSTASLPAATIPQQIERHSITHLQCTPSMAAMLLVDPDSKAALGRLRHMLVGGEALPSALAQKLTALVPRLHDMYGPTETTVWSTTWLVGDDEPVPIGRPLANQSVYVLDAFGQLVAPGEPGELWIGGAGVTRGYHGRDELTAERFVPDPFAGSGTMYRTGDLARWRGDGVLEYLGRADFQVKIRGYRIELGEIETVLAQHPGVREVAVTARHDGATGDARLCAYFTRAPADGAAPGAQPAPTADALRAHARQRLPEFMVPQHFVLLADLPRTPNQKIDRNALPAPEAASAPEAQRPRVAAASATEDAILAIWKQALGSDDVGVEDNFFDSGGHSILAVQVHRQLQETLGVKLQVTDLFRFTTVRALAGHVTALMRTDGPKAPTAAQAAMARAAARRDLRRR
ncbi:MAG: MupA/Atu3671 family FMN-dependent luciferase-like monooxygenase [Planctomycetota bacterium]